MLTVMRAAREKFLVPSAPIPIEYNWDGPPLLRADCDSFIVGHSAFLILDSGYAAHWHDVRRVFVRGVLTMGNAENLSEKQAGTGASSGSVLWKVLKISGIVVCLLGAIV